MSKKRERVRLGTPLVEPPKKQSTARMHTPEARAKRKETARKTAERVRKKGKEKVYPGHRRRELMSIYEENGKVPTVVTGSAVRRRPSFITQPSLGKRMIKLVRKGYPYPVVCKAVNIQYKTFLTWMEKGSQGYPDYADFYAAICKAEAKAEISTLDKLRRHQRNDWRVSAWELERRWPERWAKKDRVVAEMNITTSEQKDNKVELGTAVATDEHARQLARALIDGDEFGYSRVDEDDKVDG